jgi:hypothetical protein
MRYALTSGAPTASAGPPTGVRESRLSSETRGRLQQMLGAAGSKGAEVPRRGVQLNGELRC